MLWSSGISVFFLCDQQVSLCYPGVISRCLVVFLCDQQVSLCYPPESSKCPLLVFDVISRCAILIWSVDVCRLWCDHQVSMYYLCAISRFLFVFFGFINKCHSHGISRCLFVFFELISRYLCVILGRSAGVSVTWYDQQVLMLSLWDQQVSLCSPPVIRRTRRCICGQQVSVCYPCVISKLSFWFDVISRYLGYPRGINRCFFVLLLWSGEQEGVSLVTGVSKLSLCD